jgi:glycine cleavage system H protein
MMNKVPKELRYTKTHEWLKIGKDNIVTVGITDHAQEQLGDMVYVNLPKLKTSFTAGEEVGAVESVKTAADIYAPVSGTIIEINKELEGSPEKINKDPYGEGWLFRMQIEDLNSVQKLLDAEAYQNSIEE